MVSLFISSLHVPVSPFVLPADVACSKVRNPSALRVCAVTAQNVVTHGKTVSRDVCNTPAACETVHTGI